MNELSNYLRCKYLQQFKPDKMRAKKGKVTAMKRTMSWLTVGLCTVLLGSAFVTRASAQGTAEFNETGYFTVTEPLDVGSTTLQPGEYQISVIPGRWDRNMLQVWNADRTELFTTLLSVPHQEGPEGLQVTEGRYVYYPASATHNKALRTWFDATTPTSGGHDIVYPKSRALELASLAKEPVVAVPDEVKEADLETAPLVVVTPDKKVKPYETTIPEEPPVKVAEKLPQTASNVPLYAGLGLLSLLGALGLGVIARRVA